MSVNFNPIYSGYSGAINKPSDVNANMVGQSTSPLQDKTAGIDKAMSVQGIANKPIVVTSDEVTFNDNGTIVAQRMTTTYQGAKPQVRTTPKISLPAPEGKSLVEQKMHYIDKSMENSSNIKNCVFLMKNQDGSMTQYSISPDKDMPNKINVAARNSQDEDFEFIDDFKFDSSSTDTDRLMRAAVHTYIHMNGAENLYQFAVGKMS